LNMVPNQKSEAVAEFCHSIFELRYKLRKLFQLKLKEAGISISFEILEIMKVVQTQGSANQQEIADILFKDKSSITYLVDNMVKADLAYRKEDEADRRNKLIVLTDKARKLQDQLSPMAVECFLTLAEGVTDQEIKQGIEMLARMNNSLELVIV
jgi:DNA-binding MarR family transcriptional regulator